MTVPADPKRDPRPDPRRDPRAVLMTGGLLLIPLAALWLLASHSHVRPGAGPVSAQEQARLRADDAAGLGAPGLPGLPAPPRLAGGSAAQGGWTLLGASVVPPGGSPAPPPAAGVPPGRGPLLRAGPGSLALWVGVGGGVGVQTMILPRDGRRHVYPFGHFSLVSEPVISHHGSSSVSVHWEGPGGRASSPPYALSLSWQGDGAGARGFVQTATVTPLSFAARFRVTARPLSADGRPTGGAVRLLYQPVTPGVLFIPVPAGYSAATRQFRVSAARADGKGGGASWLIAGLPPAAPSAPPPGQAAARVGPFSLRATAAEAEDVSGSGDPSNPEPARTTGPTPANMDQHLRTGVPALHYVLTARAAAPPAPGQTWLLQLDRAAPQWAAPPDLGRPLTSRPLALLPLTAYARPLGADWVLQDGAVGAAYPGQQHWLMLQGSVIRQGTRTESVTFHGAQVVHDAGFGGDRIVWERPETETTASGVRICVLNGRPGRRDTGGEQASGQSSGQGSGRDWWYDRANAELLVACRLPPGVLPWARAPLGSPRVAALAADPSGALLASPDTARPDPYAGAVRLPGPGVEGGGDARALMRDGYSLLRLSVWSAQTPTRAFPHAPPSALPPNSWRDGPFVVSARPLPRRLPSLTLLVTFREEKERHPLRLVVPVRAAGAAR